MQRRCAYFVRSLFGLEKAEILNRRQEQDIRNGKQQSRLSNGFLGDALGAHLSFDHPYRVSLDPAKGSCAASPGVLDWSAAVNLLPGIFGRLWKHHGLIRYTAVFNQEFMGTLGFPLDPTKNEHAYAYGATRDKVR
jgi:hypothetical protein